MRITLITEESILKQATNKDIDQIGSADIIDRMDVFSKSDLVIVQKGDKIRVLKSRNFPLRQQTWNYEQLFRILRFTLDQAKHINIQNVIIELAKELDPKALTQLIRKLEKEGFERS